ncbi:LacI family DNA-binding transcriptional regulator [Nocardioides terrisoli]|uniref:LacI family DNA-binding transcriptional regulator n=1 Tax=Nocardioides terrisoli TaxID=3388267 RepID=UPI00287BC91A|nr:LacI family DNA-binding transcriptional regulator [Nocardioides marmorisolisilvae]
MSRVTGRNSSAQGSSSRVGIKDVARLAQVSPGTVSNVLNHPERVRAERREAVERAIQQLGYVRHEAARHLRSGTSKTIGLLLLDAWNPGFLDVARGVEDATARDGWTVLISNSARDLEREKTYLRLFAERRVAGLIAVPHDQFGENLRRIRAGGIPVTVVDRAESGDDEMSVAVDDVTGGALAAQHLLDLGHRHLAFVGDEAAAAPIHERLTGVRRAVDAMSNGSRPIRLDVIPAELTVDAGRVVGDRLATAVDRPTGIVASIDLLAFGILQALLQHGLVVPDDVSLCGYDDIPFARQLSVPLTSVYRPHYEMGTTAAAMIVGALSGEPPEPRHALFTPKLVVRESTAPPPASGRRSTA